MSDAARKLRVLLATGRLCVVPCCFDALSARLVEQAGFAVTFMSGFSVAAARLGMPDTGLISFGEVLDQGRSICQAVTIPVIGDGDTGYGNALNVKRTVREFARAGFAAVMIEDQRAPKRCGHTRGKSVVGRDEAILRIRAACDARDDARAAGGDILVLARTDAAAIHGLGEAIVRARAFTAEGADILFVEAPGSEADMATICREAPGRHLANVIDGGLSPVLPPARLAELGFALAAYPLALLSASIVAMRTALAGLECGKGLPAVPLGFDELRRLLGFDAYDEDAARYAVR
ncbi:MAG: isocitrate lyase/PEP mutase family protein [Rhodospirillales bacterium]|nr:isocitrate lyase/PEP mutase family protein [Rhodospirillales bacterium]